MSIKKHILFEKVSIELLPVKKFEIHKNDI